MRFNEYIPLAAAMSGVNVDAAKRFTDALVDVWTQALSAGDDIVLGGDFGRLTPTLLTYKGVKNAKANPSDERWSAVFLNGVEPVKFEGERAEDNRYEVRE